MTIALTLYKVTGENGAAHHGGSGNWPIPKGKRPGKWWKIEGEVQPCHNGLHLCRQSDLLEWLGPVIWEAETRGTIIECPDKVVVSEARLIRKVGGWNETTARLFACDCAERSLKFNNDPRLKECIEVARKFARGEATDKERDAAWAAAWDAAWAAARDAARAAARDAAWAAARDAAWAAARDAAWAAAWDAAWAAAWDAARAAARDAARAPAWDAARAAARDAARAAARDAAWDAAWDAARDAARAAARDAAWAAARDAAWAAAWDAARAPAWDAEQEWQETRLLQYLTGEAS